MFKIVIVLFFVGFSSSQNETIQYGKGHRTKGVDANQITTYNLESTNNLLSVDLNLEFPSPVAGNL